MQAEDRGPGPVAEDAEGQGSSEGPGGREGPGRGGTGEAGAAAGGAPQVAGSLDAPGPHGDALPVPNRPRGQLSQFSFSVPFPSPMVAELACECLTQRAQPHPAAIEQELLVSDHLLTIRLAAEDRGQLRMSILSCLHELCLFIQTVQRILPPYIFLNPRPEKGG